MKSLVQSPSFRLVWLTADGELRRAEIRAVDPEAAMRSCAIAPNQVIECSQVKVFNLREVGAVLAEKIRASAKFDTASFSQDMASLLEAGVTVKEAVTALLRKERNVARVQTLSTILSRLEQGQSFSACLRDSGAFPELLVATIVASEETGDLATGLARYAKHQVRLKAVRDKVVGACIYPGLLLAVGGMVVMLLLGVVVPKFSALIDSEATNLPFLSRLLMRWGRFVADNPSAGYSLPIMLTLLLVLGVFACRDQARVKVLLARIPGVNAVLREFDLLQMYRTTAILTARGIPIHKAFNYCMDFLNPLDAQRLLRAMGEMREGVSVSQSLANHDVSDDVATSMLAVAERTGAMADMLDRIADFYEQSLQRKIDVLSKLIEPVLMIVFGTIIGGIVVLMYLPIFDLASSIQ